MTSLSASAASAARPRVLVIEDDPAISLGLWWNFGDDAPLERSRAIVRRAFDLGITHFDLANNYGPPYGSAETNFGRVFAEDFTVGILSGIGLLGGASKDVDASEGIWTFFKDKRL